MPGTRPYVGNSPLSRFVRGRHDKTPFAVFLGALRHSGAVLVVIRDVRRAGHFRKRGGHTRAGSPVPVDSKSFFLLEQLKRKFQLNT